MPELRDPRKLSGFSLYGQRWIWTDNQHYRRHFPSGRIARRPNGRDAGGVRKSGLRSHWPGARGGPGPRSIVTSVILPGAVTVPTQISRNEMWIAVLSVRGEDANS